jgi:hypothetical protein
MQAGRCGAACLGLKHPVYVGRHPQCCTTQSSWAAARLHPVALHRPYQPQSCVGYLLPLRKDGALVVVVVVCVRVLGCCGGPGGVGLLPGTHANACTCTCT